MSEEQTSPDATDDATKASESTGVANTGAGEHTI